MDDDRIRLALMRHWQFEGIDYDKSHEIYHEDAVLEFPQSGERFEGVANFTKWPVSTGQLGGPEMPTRLPGAGQNDSSSRRFGPSVPLRGRFPTAHRQVRRGTGAR